MRPDLALKAKDKVEKQIKDGFLIVTKYPKWVANIVPIPKKDGYIEVCVNFWDLNKASMKVGSPKPSEDSARTGKQILNRGQKQ